MNERISNKDFAETDETFRAACKLVGLKPSRRLASKWRWGGGCKELQRARTLLTKIGKDNSYQTVK